jgi:L-rhamnose-H+ transport protein
MYIFSGFVFVIIAGILAGSFYLPSTFTRKWEWEHTWLIYSFSAMFIFNWIFVFLFIPEIITVCELVPLKDIIVLIVFGSLWGIGAVLFGIAMDKVGMALAYPIVLGTVSSLGALIPLVVFFPSTLFSLKGLILFMGTVVTVIGIIMCSMAFNLKNPLVKSQKTSQTGSLTAKLTIAIMAGVMSSLLNVGFSYGTSLVVEAQKLGIPKVFASNAAWAIILTSGGIPNVFYCLYLIIRRSTINYFWGTGTIRNTCLCLLMGLIWCGGIYFYGIGSFTMGSWGIVVGWIIFMSINIIVGNLWGIWRGEWKVASQQARALLNYGLIVILIAVIIVAMSSIL